MGEPRWMGDSAVLVPVGSVAQAHRVRAAFAAAALPWVVETVAGAESVLVHVDPLAVDLDVVRDVVGRADTAEVAGTRRVVRIAVRYDGADLDEVAGLTGLPVDEVVRRHAGAEYTVAFGGFAPGFGYLVGLDEALRVPRRDSPRERVPAGAVAIAGPYTGVYPRATPGGWRLLGRTEVVLFDAGREPPALFAPGDRVRFEVAR
jgi:KipI family sensor histidine kinase inhibitor